MGGNVVVVGSESLDGLEVEVVTSDVLVIVWYRTEESFRAAVGSDGVEESTMYPML